MLLFVGLNSAKAQDNHSEGEATEEAELNVKELILDHLADAYEWHFGTWGDLHISIPLPVIVKGETSGWHMFMSSRFHHGHARRIRDTGRGGRRPALGR